MMNECAECGDGPVQLCGICGLCIECCICEIEWVDEEYTPPDHECESCEACGDCHICCPL